MAIGDLADLARQSPQLMDSFANLGDDAHLWLIQAEKIEGSTSFMKAWKEFLAHYGVRGPSEIDIQMPRWYEDPLPVLRTIKEFLRREEGRHRTHQQSLIQGRQTAMEKLLNKAGRGPLGRMRVRSYKQLYYTMTEVGGMREHHKFIVNRLLAIVKETLKEVAIKLVEEKRLNQSDDVWFLTCVLI